MSLDSSVEGTPHDSASEHIGSTRDVRDQRLDAMIQIADATGTTLDAVVARLGNAPEAEWQAFTGTLAALIAARPASPIPDLHRAHQRISMALAATDEDDPDLIDAAAEIEAALLAARPTTRADAYRRMLALCPTLASDLFAPELAGLRAEIEAEIGAEVA
jgi:hypothetical protein